MLLEKLYNNLCIFEDVGVWFNRENNCMWDLKIKSIKFTWKLEFQFHLCTKVQGLLDLLGQMLIRHTATLLETLLQQAHGIWDQLKDKHKTLY